VIRLQARQPGLDSQQEQGRDIFSVPQHLYWLQKPSSLLIQWVPGALSPEVKHLGHEADHSPTSNTRAKNAWRYISTPHTSSWHVA